MNKRARYEFRLSAVEREALGRLAQADSRKISEWIREIIRREAHARGLWPGREDDCDQAAA